MQLRAETTRAADDGGRLVRVVSALLFLLGLALAGCEGSKMPDSARSPAAESDVSGAVDIGVSDSQQNDAGGLTNSDGGTADAGLDATTGPSPDADSSEVADDGAPDADGSGGGATDADGADGEDGANVDVAGSDAADADGEDVHVVVQSPSSGQACSCWPDGDDCDEFPLLNWPYKEHPPCPEGEVCTGDNLHGGTCRAKCDKPVPGQAVRLQCYATETCVTRELYDWEEDIKATDTWCLPK